MRLVARVFTVLGAVVLAAGVVVALVDGAGLEMVWLLIGPTPFYLVGVWLCRRRPENTVGLWVLIYAITFLVSLVIGEQIASLVADRPWGWVPWMVAYLVDRVSLVGGVVIFGLFPDGQPQRTYERRVLLVVVGVSLLTAALYPITQPALFVDGYPGPDVPLFASPFYVSATAFASGVVGVVDSALPIAVLVVAVVLLVLRYRRTNPTERRRIRWLMLGVGSAMVSWAILTALAGVVPPGSLLVAASVFWPMGVVLALGSVVVAVAYDGMLGIDEPVRRTVVYRTLWTLIAVLYVGAATALGLTAAEFLPVASAVLLVAGAALLFQPVQRRLERLADRWVFGNRLDGYRVLSRFGAALESAPNSAELLPALAAAVRDGLGLDWVRVCLAPGLEGHGRRRRRAGTGAGGAAAGRVD